MIYTRSVVPQTVSNWRLNFVSYLGKPWISSTFCYQRFLFTVVVVVFLFYRYKTYKLHSYEAIGSLSNENGDGTDENGKKVVTLVKKQLRTCITLFCTFLSCRCTTTTWNCLIERRSVTSRYRGSTISGWQQNQRRRRRQGDRQKMICLY